jgi:hypothetical protein
VENLVQNPLLKKAKMEAMARMGLITNTNSSNSTTNALTDFIKNFEKYQAQGLVVFICYIFGVVLPIFYWKEKKFRDFDPKINASEIIYPFLEYFPLYSLFMGHTNKFYNNSYKANVVLMIFTMDLGFTAIFTNEWGRSLFSVILSVLL